ncbi:MAG: sugar phosphate isomerase/epimerase [Spirochaetales bacterium]|jgi:sugar phosphate isomerase/epimerase|nr:sugar phosphate isomerase/epimerase [Spirochaetales bacterium]
MKYSFMSFSVPGATLSELFDLAREYGYEGIEPRIDAEHGHGIETSMSADERQEVKRMAAARGVEIGCLATSLQFALPEKADETIAYSREVINLAGDLGCPMLRVFGGDYGESVSREQATELCITGLSAVADYAHEQNVVLAFETHDAWTDPDLVVSLIEKVNSPAVRVNWDFMHPLRQSGVSIEKSFEILQDLIAHVHVHDGNLDLDNLQVLPMGTGEIDHKIAIRLLRESGYTGYISGEWILSIMPDDFQTKDHLGSELKELRKYEALA